MAAARRCRRDGAPPRRGGAFRGASFRRPAGRPSRCARSEAAPPTPRRCVLATTRRRPGRAATGPSCPRGISPAAAGGPRTSYPARPGIRLGETPRSGRRRRGPSTPGSPAAFWQLLPSDFPPSTHKPTERGRGRPVQGRSACPAQSRGERGGGSAAATGLPAPPWPLSATIGTGAGRGPGIRVSPRGAPPAGDSDRRRPTRKGRLGGGPVVDRERAFSTLVHDSESGAGPL